MPNINWLIWTAPGPSIPSHPTYGNYGGRGWTGGEFNGDPYLGPPAVNDLDAAFQRHDQQFNESDPHASYEANKRLLDDINDLRADPNSDWNNGEMDGHDRLYGDHTYDAFLDRVRDYEDEYNIPPEDRWEEPPPPPPLDLPSLWVPLPGLPTNPTWEPPPEEDPFENPPTSPLVFDLDGDGVDFIALEQSNAYFDLDTNGFAEHTAWIGADDGFLALDINGNGKIDDRTELFGAQDAGSAATVNGFTALASIDSNGDNVINAQDASFGDLVIWHDVNGDGLTDAGELLSLSALGITSIDLGATYVNEWHGDNWVSHESTFTTTNGTGTISDVWFETDTMRSLYRYGDAPLEFDADVVLLPDLKGYGTLPDLHVAMQEDLELRQSVTNLINNAATLPQADFLTAIESVLFEWAGVDDVAVGSRGPHVNAQRLAFMEQLYGREWKDWSGSSNDPGSAAGDALEGLYGNIIGSLTAKFLTQVPLAIIGQQASSGEIDLLDFSVSDIPYSDLLSVSYDAASDQLNGTADDLISQAVSHTSAPAAPRADSVSRVANAINLISLFHVDFGLAPSALEAQVRSTFGTLGAQWTEIVDAVYAERPLVVGTESDDTINGQNFGEVIIGSAGNDVIDGKDGDDIYIWSRGDGNDTIIEKTNDGRADRLVLDGATSSDITLVRNGIDVTLVIAASAPGAADGGSILLKNQLDAYYWQGVEEIQFGDGMTWSADELRALVLAQEQTPGDDVIVGFYADDVITGGLGNDLLKGQKGNDTYVWARGDGNDTIVEQTNSGGGDSLHLDGVNVSDLTLVRDGIHVTLVIGESTPGAGDGGSIRLEDQLDAYFSRGVEQISFGDGTIWSASDLRVNVLALEQTSGNDTITGFNTADTLNGGGGNDSINGKGGNDTYIWARGDGNDTIVEQTNSGGGDSLHLDGVNVSDLTLVRDGIHVTLVIGESTPGAGDGGSIRLEDQLDAYFSRGVEQISFGDGTTWTAGDLRANVLAAQQTTGDDIITGFNTNDFIAGGMGNDSLSGGKGADRLDGGSGNDILNGGADSDTFVFGSGYGQDLIQDFGSNDHLEVSASLFATFSDVLAASQQVGSDVVITAAAGDQLTLTNFALASLSNDDVFIV